MNSESAYTMMTAKNNLSGSCKTAVEFVLCPLQVLNYIIFSKNSFVLEHKVFLVFTNQICRRLYELNVQ